MKVDRSLFLLMTGAMAAEACPAGGDGRVPSAPVPPARGSSGPALASGAEAPIAAECLDGDPSDLPDCSTMNAPDRECAPFPFPQERCVAFGAYFRPKVAAQARSCMTSLSGQEVCDADRTYGCAKTALARACPDPAVEELCSSASGPCRSSATECRVLLSGLNDAGRQKIAECVAEGCQFGLYPCVEGL